MNTFTKKVTNTFTIKYSILGAGFEPARLTPYDF